MGQVAAMYPTVKFIKSISTTCIPNYPDKNLPTIFIYFEGELKKQIIGPVEFRQDLTAEGIGVYSQIICKFIDYFIF